MDNTETVTGTTRSDDALINKISGMLDELRHERDSQTSQFGLNQIVSGYEDQIARLQQEKDQLLDEIRALKDNRQHILSVLNFLKSSAFSIPTPEAQSTQIRWARRGQLEATFTPWSRQSFAVGVSTNCAVAMSQVVRRFLIRP